MSRARVTIAGHTYTIGCAPGEEERIATLAGELETMMADLSDTLGDVDERTLAVMAGLSAMERLASAEAAIVRLKARNEALERARENAVLALDGDDEALVTRLETVAAAVERVAGLINRDTRARNASAPLRAVAVTDEAPEAPTAMTAKMQTTPPPGEDAEPEDEDGEADAVVPSRGPSAAPTEAGGLGRLDINPAAAMRR